MQSGQKIYVKGQNLVLDKELERFRKQRLWRGDAIHHVFNDDDEFQAFGELWIKERQASRKMTVDDILKLIGFAHRITAWRAQAKRRADRKRAEDSRKKLRKAADDGNSTAMSKLRKLKRAAKERWGKCNERKRRKKGLEGHYPPQKVDTQMKKKKMFTISPPTVVTVAEVIQLQLSL